LQKLIAQINAYICICITLFDLFDLYFEGLCPLSESDQSSILTAAFWKKKKKKKEIKKQTNKKNLNSTLLKLTVYYLQVSNDSSMTTCKLVVTVFITLSHVFL